MITMFGPGKFPHVESNEAAGSTPSGALPSIPESFSLATILTPELKHFDFAYSGERKVYMQSRGGHAMCVPCEVNVFLTHTRQLEWFTGKASSCHLDVHRRKACPTNQEMDARLLKP